MTSVLPRPLVRGWWPYLEELLLAVAALLVPSVALAQVHADPTLPVDEPWPGSTPDVEPEFPEFREAPRHDGGRLRFGYDLGLTSGLGVGGPSCTRANPCVMATPSLALDLGHQFGTQFALYARGELGIALLSNYAGASLRIEVTPTRLLSLSTGVGVEGNATVGGANWVQGYGGIAIPVQLHFNFLQEEEWLERGRNTCWRLGVGLIPGVEPTTGLFMFRGALTLGYAYM